MNGSNFSLGCLAFAVALQAACGGSGGSASPTPVTGGTPTPASVTIAIVGQSGSQAYDPATPSVAANQTFGFSNRDVVVHRIVADNGTFDSGNLSPGAVSASIVASSNTPVPFHCTIHPSMVGSINGTSAAGAGGGGGTPPPEY